MDRFPEDILGTYFNIHSLKSFWENNCNEINLYKQCLCSHLVSSTSQPQLAYMSSVVDCSLSQQTSSCCAMQSNSNQTLHERTVAGLCARDLLERQLIILLSYYSQWT